MTDAVPIRPGIEPDLDVAREMRDYVWAKIDDYVKAHGVPPKSIAVALLGDENAPTVHSIAHSWTPKGRGTVLTVCASAAAMMMKRAMEP